MNIGIVTTWFERGAAYVSVQYRNALKKDNNIFIYARGGESTSKNDVAWDNENVTWGKNTNNPLATAVDLPDFKNWILNNKIELVFFNEQHCWEPIILCSKIGVKIGAYIDYYTEETIPLFGCYDFLICNTKRHFETFKWHPQVSYIPWGTDTKLFNLKNINSVEKEVLTFFHSAGYSPERKGTDLLIIAFEKIRGNAKLVIHSQVKLRDQYPNLHSLIDKLEKQNRLICIEKTVTAPGLYHLGDVYVYPSRLDGIGLTIAEALSCGMPIITCDNPPMNEFITSDNGRLVNIDKLYSRKDGYYWPQCEANISSLVECMQYYVDNIDDISNEKLCARNFALRELDWETNSKNITNLFKSYKCLNSNVKADALKLAEDFECKRMTLQQRYPRLFVTYKFVKKIFKMV